MIIADVTITANGTNNIYDLQGYDKTTYSISRTHYVGKSTGNIMQCGQKYDSAYRVYRATLVFDLSSISYVGSAVLKLTGYQDLSDSDFNIHVYGYTLSSLTGSDAGFIAYGTKSFGFINSSNYSAISDGMSIQLNGFGIEYINSKRGGDCIFMLVSDEDINESEPTGIEYIKIYSGEYATSEDKPHLELTYATWKPQIRFF